MHNDIAAVKRLTNVALTSTNANAFIGDGHMDATFQVVANVMTLNLLVVWGTTSTFGTGYINVPLPAGYTYDDIDADAMNDLAGNKGTPIYAAGTINNAPATPFLIAFLVPGQGFFLYPLWTYGFVPGDFLLMKMSFPLK